MTVAAEPLRETFLEQVRADTERALAHADEQVAAKLLAAEERGRALVEQARADGIAAASIAGAHEEARARRRARAVVLAARRELYEELARQAREAAHALRETRRYASLLDRLSEAARAQLGADAVVEIDPPDAGGVRASNGTRHVDYTLDAVVERCLERVGGELEQLWR